MDGKRVYKVLASRGGRRTGVTVEQDPQAGLVP
jgi:hypothetical protein